MTDYKTIRANGMEFAYHEAGDEKAPLVILLHGFPDTFHCWDPILPKLAEAGFHAVAPALRGYAPSALAPDGDYRIWTLARDLIALVEHFGADKAHVIAHDWGSAIAQFAINLRPDRFGRVVLSAVPHLRKFLLKPTPAQLKRSHYIFKFQAPMWAERALTKNNFDWLENVLWRKWSPTWDFTDADILPVKANLADPRRMKAALQYYRSIPLLYVNPPQARVAFAPVSVPVRMIYGTEDGAIGPEMFQKQDKLFRGGFDLCEATGRGHFMQCEDPVWYAEKCVEWLKG